MISTFREPTTTIDGLSIDAAHVSAVPTAAGSTVDSVNSAIAEVATKDRVIVECHSRERRRPARALESGETRSPGIVLFLVKRFFSSSRVGATAFHGRARESRDVHNERTCVVYDRCRGE